jgi:hypothetical protein
MPGSDSGNWLVELLQLSHSRFCFGALRKERSEKRHHGGIRASRRNAVPSLIVSPDVLASHLAGVAVIDRNSLCCRKLRRTARCGWVLPISAELAYAPVNGRWA